MTGEGAVQLSRIVVVEDDPSTVRLTRMMFEFAGMMGRLDFMTSAAAFRAYMAALVAGEAALPELVLVDVNLPQESGFTLLREWKNVPELAAVPVGIVSGSELPADRERAREYGAYCYLVKPLRLAQIRQLLQGQAVD